MSETISRDELLKALEALSEAACKQEKRSAYSGNDLPTRKYYAGQAEGISYAARMMATMFDLPIETVLERENITVVV